MDEQVNNEYLIEYLISKKVLYSKEVIKAFHKIDRIDFVLEEFKNYAYENMPLSISYSQTISQPQVVSFMLELLDVKAGNKILDIGSGSAYTTSLLSKITGKKGFVTGLERLDELVKFGNENLKKYKIKNVKIQKSEKKLGLKNKSFDRILVSAAADILPIELIRQLKEKGKLVIPIKNSIFLIEKKDKEIKYFEYKGFNFVPLIYSEDDEVL